MKKLEKIKLKEATSFIEEIFIKRKKRYIGLVFGNHITINCKKCNLLPNYNQTICLLNEIKKAPYDENIFLVDIGYKSKNNSKRMYIKNYTGLMYEFNKEEVIELLSNITNSSLIYLQFINIVLKNINNITNGYNDLKKYGIGCC